MIDMRRAHGTGMAARLRSDGRWETRITVGRDNGRQVQRSFFSSLPGDQGRREVERKRDEALRQFEFGVILAGDRVTVERYLGDWLESMRIAVRPSTWTRYRQIVVNNIVPLIGNIPIAKLTPAAVERMLAAAQVSPRTRHHMRAVLRSALQRAVKHGTLVRNAAALAAPPKVEQVEAVILTPEQVRVLLRQVSGDRWEAVYWVAVATGLRQGEILGLTWPDVDLEHGVLRVARQMHRRQLVEPKTRRSRRQVGIPPSVVAVLRAHRLRQEQQRRFVVRGDWGNDDELVFTNSMGGPVHGPHVTRDFQRHLAAAGLPRMPFHATRHSAASLMLALGIDGKVRQAILGHSTAAMTAHYTHVLSPSLREAADAMERVLLEEAR